MKRRDHALLLCPNIDTELQTIVWIARTLNMTVLDDHTTVGLPPQVVAGIQTYKFREIWIVTPEIEAHDPDLAILHQRLRAIGLSPTILIYRSEHSTHIDRPSPKTTLAEFISLADIDREDCRLIGASQKIQRGVGILHHEQVNGLRVAGYTRHEIMDVFALYRTVKRSTSMVFSQMESEARLAWARRRNVHGFILVTSRSSEAIRELILQLMLEAHCEHYPLLLASNDQSHFFLHNIDPFLRDRLMSRIKEGTPCLTDRKEGWSFHHQTGGTKYTSDDIFNALLP